MIDNFSGNQQEKRVSHVQTWRWPLLLALVGWLAVMATRGDPGITSDEPFDVVQGKGLVAQFLRKGLRFFAEESIDFVFGRTESHQHPPLGRWVIGWVHWLQDPRPSDPYVFDIISARAAPATAFALTLLLVARAAAVWYGTVAGVVAGIALLLMPRVFADAHFAALDTIMSCTYLMSVLSAGWMMQGPRPWLRGLVAGLLLGCALLTKLNGFFLLPLVGLWTLAFHRQRALLPVGLWALSGGAVFIAGWPWMWHDTVARLAKFLGTSVDRQTIYVWYLGQTWRDADVPWHYPWVLFAVTVPVGLHVLGLWGVWRYLRQRPCDSHGGLLLGAVAFPLLVFSVPGVPVYDGVRLFLAAFPMWAMFVGRGAAAGFEWLQQRIESRWAAVALAGFMASQSFGLFHYHPFQLSYYNLLVGGLRGADRLGFEVSYWGDAVTQKLLDDWSKLAPQKACAVLVPAKLARSTSTT